MNSSHVRFWSKLVIPDPRGELGSCVQQNVPGCSLGPFSTKELTWADLSLRCGLRLWLGTGLDRGWGHGRTGWMGFGAFWDRGMCPWDTFWDRGWTSFKVPSHPNHLQDLSSSMTPGCVTSSWFRECCHALDKPVRAKGKA